jgi:dolichol-phosphate mannosyltransferase
MSRALVVMPTYKEADNVQSIIPEILATDESVEVLVVDDNSPDGTGDLVAGMMSTNNRIHLIRRERKMGLGTAYVRGFKYAIEHGYDYVFEMDADFSHDPKEIPNFLAKIKEYDLVIGSRYVTGVAVVNWPMKRLLLSYFANIYSRVVTGMPVKDATGGFKCYRVEILKHIDLDGIHSNGYAFQIEIDYKVWKKGFRVVEMPIVFVDRRVGISKMSKKIVYEALFMVWILRFKSIVGRL